MDRTLFNEEHELFRQSFRKFVEREVIPNQERWMEQGSVDRATWKKAGEAGFLCSESVDAFQEDAMKRLKQIKSTRIGMPECGFVGSFALSRWRSGHAPPTPVRS